MKKEKFKAFALTHKNLANEVLNGNTTWQKLYELYDIYGEDEIFWNSLSFKTQNNSIKNITNIFSKIDEQKLIDLLKNLETYIGLAKELLPMLKIDPSYKQN